MTASRGGALAVAAGILLSRLLGLVRERVFAHYLGNGAVAGVFRAAMRIPNLLQNLFGEGVLSGSFIPVYARLLAEGREDDARRVAGFVVSALLVVTGILVALGVTFAGALVGAVSPGYAGAERRLTIELVQILFLATGLLVPSAWCLGVLNSHRRFFLPYVAPVVWNLAQIAALVLAGIGMLGAIPSQTDLVVVLAWGVVAGSALQLLVQLPSALRLARPRAGWGSVRPEVGQVVGAFLPTLIGRGVVQIAAYVDLALASFLGSQAVSSIGYAQILFLLPVSLFGMSISAAELPEMARALGSDDEVRAKVVDRLRAARARVGFFVAPTTLVFLVLGEVVVGTLFQTGRFGADDARVVWLILAAQSLGLIATTEGRLFASTLYALRDPRTPMRAAVLRLAIGGGLGALAVTVLPPALGWGWIEGAAGLAAAGSIAAWAERVYLGVVVGRRLAGTGGDARAWSVWLAASVAAAGAWGLHQVLPPLHPLLRGAVVLGVCGALYLGGTVALGHPQGRALLRRVLRR